MLAEDVKVVQVVVFAVVQERALAEVPEIELHQFVVAVKVNVGPHQPDDDAEDEREGVFLEEGYVPADLVHGRLSKLERGKFCPAATLRASKRANYTIGFKTAQERIPPTSGQSRFADA